MCQKLKKVWKQILIINEPQRRLSIFTFGFDSIFDFCGTRPATMLCENWASFGAKTVHRASDKIKKRRAAYRATSIISLTSRENTTSQHYWDPSDARTLAMHINEKKNTSCELKHSAKPSKTACLKTNSTQHAADSKSP